MVQPLSSSRVRPSVATGRLEVWIDFVCPYCFLAEKPIEEALRGLNLQRVWMPFELRPSPQPTLHPEREYLQTVWKQSVYPLAAHLGIDIRLPSVSPQPYSQLAFEGLQFATEYDKASEYVDAVFRAFFQRDLDIGSIDILETLARDIGLPTEAFRTALMSGKYATAHAQALGWAAQLRIRVVPTIFVGNGRIEGMPDSLALRVELEALALGGC